MRPFQNLRQRLSNVAQEAQSQYRMGNVWETYLCRGRMYVFLPYRRGPCAHHPLSGAKPSTRNMRCINRRIKKQGYKRLQRNTVASWKEPKSQMNAGSSSLSAPSYPLADRNGLIDEYVFFIGPSRLLLLVLQGRHLQIIDLCLAM